MVTSDICKDLGKKTTKKKTKNKERVLKKTLHLAEQKRKSVGKKRLDTCAVGLSG